jgi:hypothetical protein
VKDGATVLLKTCILEISRLDIVLSRLRILWPSFLHATARIRIGTTQHRLLPDPDGTGFVMVHKNRNIETGLN